MKKLLATIALLCAASGVAHGQTTLGQRTESLWAIDDTTAVGMADSSKVFDCRAYRTLGIMVRVTHAGGSGDVKLAISFRPQLTDSGSTILADSLSISQVLLSEQFSIASHGAGDSTAFGNYVMPTSSQVGSGEIIFTSKPKIVTAGKWQGPQASTFYMPVRALRGSLLVRVLSASANTSRIRVAITGFPY